MREPHEALGVSPDAEWLVIEAAWRALMKRYHPDVDGSDEAAARAREVNAAYDALKARREAHKGGPNPGSAGYQSADRGPQRPNEIAATRRPAMSLPAWGTRLRGSHALAAAIGALAVAVLVWALRPADLQAEGASGREPAVQTGAATAAASSVPPVAETAPAKEKPDPPDLSRATISSAGLGPVKIGMRRQEVEALAGPLTRHHGEYACEVFDSDNYPGIDFLFEEGRLSRVSAYRLAGVRSPRGLGAGSNADQVRAAYGPRLLESPHVYVPDGGLYLIYLIEPEPSAGPSGLKFETDERGRVTAVHGGGPSIGYVEGCL